METMEISEIAIRLKDFGKLHAVFGKLNGLLGNELNKQGKPAFELHTWEKLSPFFNIAKMIDLMTFFIKLMLMAIVLISIMNVMVMAVYERIREIGTPAELRERYQVGTIIEVTVRSGAPLPAALFGQSPVSRVEPVSQSMARMHIDLGADLDHAIAHIMKVLVQNAIPVRSIRHVQPSLEEVYLTLTGGGRQ